MNKSNGGEVGGWGGGYGEKGFFLSPFPFPSLARSAYQKKEVVSKNTAPHRDLVCAKAYVLVWWRSGAHFRAPYIVQLPARRRMGPTFLGTRLRAHAHIFTYILYPHMQIPRRQVVSATPMIRNGLDRAKAQN